MFKRVLTLAALALAPATALAALPNAPLPVSQVTVSSAKLDSFSDSSLNSLQLKQQGLYGYDATFHTATNSYAYPLCNDVSLVEVDGRAIDPTAFVPGDTLSITLRPNSASNPAACLSRIVRNQIGRGPSSGECLQNFQVKHEIEGGPDKLYINKQYTYHITAYVRPSFDCDGKAYGSAPVTTTVAAHQPFEVALMQTSSNSELMRWTITTDAQGKAEFAFSFDKPSDSYQFQVSPGSDDTAGDTITWDANVLDPNPSPSPLPATNTGGGLSPWPIIVFIVIIGVGAGAAEYFHRKRYFTRLHETPEDEYRRSEKIRWRD